MPWWKPGTSLHCGTEHGNKQGQGCSLPDLVPMLVCCFIRIHIAGIVWVNELMNLTPCI